MSREAIAAALARTDLSSGERLVAFSLARFADRENRARPGTPAAAARAGMERSGYLEARDRLVRRGLLVVEVAAKGRGRRARWRCRSRLRARGGTATSTPSCSRQCSVTAGSQGSARLLAAALAALSDERGVVAEVTTEQLCAAAGLSDRTYRRMHGALLASGEVVIRSSPGGRGNTNRWEIRDPRAGTAAAAPRSRRRVAPPAGVRPLIATVAPPPMSTSPLRSPAPSRASGVATSSAPQRPLRTGWLRRRTVRACQGFRRERAVRFGQFRPRTGPTTAASSDSPGRIVALMPPHRVYLEPFAGGAAPEPDECSVAIGIVRRGATARPKQSSATAVDDACSWAIARATSYSARSRSGRLPFPRSASAQVMIGGVAAIWGPAGWGCARASTRKRMRRRRCARPPIRRTLPGGKRLAFVGVMAKLRELRRPGASGVAASSGRLAELVLAPR